MRKVKVFLILLVVAVCMFGCKGNLDVSYDENGGNNSLTPYATESELNEYKEGGFVNYRVSRYFAMLAMNDFAETNGWYNVSLSEYPVIIYNAETNEPRYYEFRVLSNEKEIGAISCVAKETEGDAVQYVLPYVLEVDSQDIARAVRTGEYKLTDYNYPSGLIIKNRKNARLIDPAGKDIEGDVTKEITIKDILSEADEDMIEDLGITEELAEELLLEQEKQAAELREYWEKIRQNEEILLAVTDEEILAAYDRKYNSNSRAITTTTSEKSNILPSWKEKSWWYNPKGWCGPNCVCFITLGLGKKSGYANVPLTDDKSKIYAMYKAFENKIGTGAKLIGDLNKGLSAYTDYKLVSDVGHIYSVIAKNISRNNPSISLRGSKGLTSDTIQWHYRTVIGTKTVTNTTKVTAFGYTLLTFNTYDNYYAIHDNGCDNKVQPDGKGFFFEKSNQIYQLWSAHVEER